jgi:tRNA (adenine57-N1/adenine58-N1)-methyltransferase catalytic subunit
MGTMEGHSVQKGERVILLGEGGAKITLLADGEMKRVGGMGIVDTGNLVGKSYGSVTTVGVRRYLVLRPSVLDRIETVRRKAQIILPKDSAHIVMNCDIRSGSTVVEAGSGSGGLTVVLAGMVRPGGKVISYDIRDDMLGQARDNVEYSGLSDFVEFKMGDVCTGGGITERNVDAVVFDLPEPWNALSNAWDALKPCGHVACYTPTTNQVEQTVRALKAGRWIEVFAEETLQRQMCVVEKGIRPAFEMLGHSGYLTYARKVLDTF